MTTSRALARPNKVHTSAPFDAQRISRRVRRQSAFWLSIGVVVLLFVQSYLRNKHSDVVLHTRKLLSSSGCSSHAEWIENGGVALHFVGTCYLFAGLYIVCKYYFVKSLEEISRRLNLSQDVAGATFMAAGSSAPELFTSFVALTNDHASNEIGVGTIVGSAVFNMLVIIGISVIFSGRKLYLDYRPLVRDCLFYTTAIIGVIAVFSNGKIYWWEGLIFVMLYGLYILAMRFNKRIMHMFPPPGATREESIKNDLETECSNIEPLDPCSSSTEVNDENIVNGEDAPLVPTTKGETSQRQIAIPQPEQDDQNGTVNTNTVAACGQNGENNNNLFPTPEGKLERLYWMVLLPWRVIFHYTLPDCTKENRKNWYMATFVLSILWIGVISWYMVEWATTIGCVLGIPSTIMGVTVLAAGTSIPDAISSIDVAKKGEGDMAVANAVGSNVFDILLGLGLPWLFVIPFTGTSSSSGNYIEVDNNELLLSVGILVGVLVFYMVCIIISGWKISKSHGFAFIFLYVVYALYYIIVEWALDI